jgi:TorA maturation chaperone TorD
MTHPATHDLQLLAQADLLLLVADLLRPPPKATLEEINRDGRFLFPLLEEEKRDGRFLFPALDELDDVLIASRLPASEPLRAAFHHAIALARQLPADPWPDEYHRLFEGATACPPNETAYIRRDKGAIIADINGFYLAFGFTSRPDSGEKPDHILAQLEFVAMLLVMTAAAMRENDPEKQHVTRRALASFADAHLGDWLPSFCHRLLTTTTLDFYAAAAAALRHLWDALGAAHQLPQPATPDLAPQGEPESPCECAAATTTPVELNIRGTHTEA